MFFPEGRSRVHLLSDHWAERSATLWLFTNNCTKYFKTNFSLAILQMLIPVCLFSVNAASKIVVPQASINVSNVAQEYLTEIERLVTKVMVALWSFPPSIF